MHAAIKRLAVKLSKICNDLRLLSSGPRAELKLPCLGGEGQRHVVSDDLEADLVHHLRDGIEANEEVCRRNVLDSIGIVTYLNPVIGHHNGDLVGRECARSGRSGVDSPRVSRLMDSKMVWAITGSMTLS